MKDFCADFLFISFVFHSYGWGGFLEIVTLLFERQIFKIMCILWICRHAHIAMVHMYSQRITCGRWFSPVWLLEIKLSLSGLVPDWCQVPLLATPCCQPSLPFSFDFFPSVVTVVFGIFFFSSYVLFALCNYALCVLFLEGQSIPPHFKDWQPNDWVTVPLWFYFLS